MTDSSHGSIESVLHETRVFPPPSPERAGVPRWLVPSMDAYRAMHARSISDPEGFWGEVAGELGWFKPWDKVLEWNAPDAKWFVGGQTNLCYNCVDRHVEQGRGDRIGIVWEGEPMQGGAPEIRRLSYAQLQKDIARFANALREQGVRKGDVVTIYMGMVPELAIAVLACARIGAAHSVIFGGFSAQAIADRVTDASSKVIVTCDGAWRRGGVVPLKKNVDDAIGLLDNNIVQSVIVLRRCANEVAMTPGRDHDWGELVAAASDDCPCEPLDSEHMSFLLYTSGSTGKPKGIVHTHGGYQVGLCLTTRVCFDLRSGHDVFLVIATPGWITGQSYMIAAALLARVPSIMLEGSPVSPPDRFASTIQFHGVTVLKAGSTFLRMLMTMPGGKHSIALTAASQGAPSPPNPSSLPHTLQATRSFSSMICRAYASAPSALSRSTRPSMHSHRRI